ncbi:fusion protein [Agrobacterium tumefaciens]|uniref:fusion protein n=1 Tax=Agrobacterium tumefaciens TaxID=358 RepID=UPI001CBF1F65|nr:fusion protein [Agrobacterium tumefaciens]MDP9875631.1 hypothetical protein [Agrobacterium tumefaciens]MDP9980546.1 hypothetical protein [Agrobacterium tumefaciens]
MTALYKDGTVTLVQGSPVIVGNDTGWKVALIVGGTVFVEAEGGSPLPILPDDSDGANLHPITNTQMTAAIKWTGASGTYNYAIVRDMSYSRQQSANADALALYLQRLNNPSLAAVSGLVPEADSLILFTGPDTATVIQRASLVQGVDYDEDADDIAGRNLYSSEAKGFSVLVANAGDGRTAIFIKRSSTDGDWSVPFYLSGPVGPKGDTGATGITDAGIYAAANAYAVRDAVLDNGSTWLAKGAVPPGNPPPVLPAQQNDYWRLLARRGTDGTGIGDVVGPDGAADGLFAVSDGTSGKKIKFITDAQVRRRVGGWEPVRDPYNLAGVSQAIWTDLSEYVALFLDVEARGNAGASSGIIFGQISSDNGASWRGGAADYVYFGQSQEGTALTGFGEVSSQFMNFARDSVAAASLLMLKMKVGNFNKATSSMFKSEAAYARQGGQNRQDFISGYVGVEVVKNAFRFACTGGAFATGTAQLFGLRG